MIENKDKYILAFKYDNKYKKYMVHGLWINSASNYEEHEYTLPYDPTNFLKYNWYDKYYSDTNTLFEYEYKKHGICFNLDSTQYLNLTKKIYQKHYDKYVLNMNTDKKKLRLFLDENFDYIRSEFKD